jgi:hypothetical protein
LCKKPALTIYFCAFYFCALLVAEAAPAPAEDPCAGFKWDVSQERALFVFDLDAKRHLMLQFSAASQAVIRLTVTRVLVE